MSEYPSISESPLSVWWRENRFVVDEACFEARRGVGRAAAIRRLFKLAVQGEVLIDDRRLRQVVGYLIAESDGALEAIQQHRQWAKARRGD